MARSYYVQIAGGAVRGPMSSDDVRAAAANGELQPQDSIRDAAHPAWRPLSSVKGLTFGPPSGRADDAVTLREAVAPIIGGVKAVSRGAARLFGHSSGSSSETPRQAREDRSNGSAEPQVVARSYDSPEEAREAALRTLALMRAQGELTEGQYQERRRQIIGVPPVHLSEPEPNESDGYQRRRLASSRGGSERQEEANPKRQMNPMLAAVIGVVVCWLGYSYVVETGPFAKKANQQKQQRPQARTPGVAAAPPQPDPRMSFLTLADCIRPQLQSAALADKLWVIQSCSPDVHQTTSLITPFEGQLTVQFAWVYGGEYIATIHFLPQDQSWRPERFEITFNGPTLRENKLDFAKESLERWLKGIDYSKCP